CRMDTVELNIFPVGGAVPTGTALTPGRYQTTIHESDPKFATLGVNKFKCFVVDTTKAATSSPTTNNVACDGTVPPWLSTVPQSRTGWDGSNVTREFSPIIPDGLLTPGSHVQYFYRKSHAANPNLNYVMCPDTNFITPQASEGSTDPHRWQQFGVLPDRWKNAAFGGAGSACLLYVDWDDRRGNEGQWVAVMDSLCATASVKFGAHNGWHANGVTNLKGLDVRTDPSVVVANKNSQPGTTWDMYGVKASESLSMLAGSLGSRIANRANMGFAAGRECRQGPTPEMLRAYYRMVAILTGDLSAGILSPYVNRSQNDIALLNDYLTMAGGLPQPRGLFIQGDGFGQSENATRGIDPAHGQFLTDKLGVVFRAASYQSLAGNLNDCADLLTTAALTANADAYGVLNTCAFSNDVYNRNPALGEATEGTFYENVGLNGPYVADVVKTAVPLRNWVAVTSGYDIDHLLTRYCDNAAQRRLFYYYMLNKVFSSICFITGPPSCALLDVPGSGGTDIVGFMKIGNSVMRGSPASVRLGIAQAGRVRICIYDVAGRRVRTLADRVFPAGEQVLRWDGTDDAGTKVGRGVYFVRSSNDPSTGRIIVLNR
ncbi:MAG TPA: FlgD immunoglobulin-like domain containing protein, partial [Actinomycetota bacterium]|nr:FlgD immunoglobulin-like domain containing protein [Actinomycetota bacterium]